MFLFFMDFRDENFCFRFRRFITKNVLLEMSSRKVLTFIGEIQKVLQHLPNRSYAKKRVKKGLKRYLRI